jgi:hypothetical protein
MAIPGQGEGKHASATSASMGGTTNVDCGTEITGQVYFPGGVSLFSGNGAPGKTVNGKAPVIGDIYIRLDGSVGSLLYRATVPASGTWVVVL